MERNEAIAGLVAYGVEKGLIDEGDRVWAINTLLDRLKVDGYQETEQREKASLPELLEALTSDAVNRGVVEQDSVVYRDLFDTELMGVLTPRPSQVRKRFAGLREHSPREATDWFYQFSQDTNYIRRDRIAKDVQWKADTEYGQLDITINLSKPEKDPRAIAAAKNLPAGDYPRCLLCRENEGYAGRLNHPARQNLRPIPMKVYGQDWQFQYSPYGYYNEHCIVFNTRHIPMVIDSTVFEKLMDIVDRLPHYFVGSNADLPIVGGSILSHEHFQGGHYTFAMEKAEMETHFTLPQFEGVEMGTVKWPMSVIRLRSEDRKVLSAAASYIHSQWRTYSDPEVGIYAETDGTPHNTVTPIMRKKGSTYECDLVLRNNLTSEERPLGIFHPNPSLHHIKKENIGLIEVMGLAVLPARLKKEMALLEDAVLKGEDLRQNEVLEKHADWAEEWMKRYEVGPENIHSIVQAEIGKVFAKVLEHAGVYARTPEGQDAFLRFLRQV